MLNNKSIDTLIVGAGFAGMYSLYKQISDGFKSEIYEQGDGVGGTWYWNRYPGARCDIENNSVPMTQLNRHTHVLKHYVTQYHT